MTGVRFPGGPYDCCYEAVLERPFSAHQGWLKIDQFVTICCNIIVDIWAAFL